MTFKNRIILKSEIIGQLIEDLGLYYIRNTENFYNFKNHVRTSKVNTVWVENAVPHSGKGLTKKQKPLLSYRWCLIGS